MPSGAGGCEAWASLPAGFLGQQQEKVQREQEQNGAMASALSRAWELGMRQ